MSVLDVVLASLSVVIAFFVGIWRGTLTYGNERIPLDGKDFFVAMAGAGCVRLVFILFPSVEKLEEYLRIFYTAVFVSAFLLIGFLGYGVGRVRLLILSKKYNEEE